MNKEEIMNKIQLYEFCENMEELYDDYYVPLQQENKQLKDKLYEAERRNNELEQDGQDMAKELGIRIDKAIEYIEIQQIIFKDYDIVSENQLKNLLEILKGDSNAD